MEAIEGGTEGVIDTKKQSCDRAISFCPLYLYPIKEMDCMFLFFLWKGAGWGMRALRAYSNIGYGSLGVPAERYRPQLP